MSPALGRVILHIGRHKSGTSSLQRYLSQNQAALRAAGWLYPSAGQDGRLAHHLLAESAATEKARQRQGFEKSLSAEEFHRALAEETLNWHGSLIFSSEAFQNVQPNRLKSYFPPGQTTVVVYLREQAEYAISSYQQKVQATNSSLTLEAHCLARAGVDYFKFLNQWATAYGKDHLIVARYARDQLLNKDIVADFCSRTGIPLVGTPITADQNPSIGGGLLELKRLSNLAGLSNREQSTVYLSYSRAAMSDARLRRKPVLSAAVLRKLKQHTADTDAHAAQAYFGEPHLFSPVPDADEPNVLPGSELCLAMAALARANTPYALSLTKYILAPEGSKNLDEVADRVVGRLLNGVKTPVLLKALKGFDQSSTAGAWAWNSLIDWQR